MNTVFTFVILGAAVRVTVSDATGQVLAVVSPQPVSPQVFSLACAQARMAWESLADSCLCA